MSPRVSRQREINGEWAAYVLGVEASPGDQREYLPHRAVHER